MRLIDVEELNKDLTLKKRILTAKYGEYSSESGSYMSWKEVFDLVNNAPTVDAVPVVQCKDCKYWERKDGLVIGYCGAAKHGYKSTNWDIGIYRMTMDTGYCSDGERKDDADD